MFPICLGAGDLGSKIRGDEVDRLLDVYAEAGGNFLDTAHVYACWTPEGAGVSERALGAWMKKRANRADLTIATKGGHPPLQGYAHDPNFLSRRSLEEDLSESLERLETDWIDLYYLHRDDGRTPVEEIVDTLNGIPALRALGASNWSLARVKSANTYATQSGQRGFAYLQNQWSLAIPDWGDSVDPCMRFVSDEEAEECRRLNLTVHPYSSTANGYFSSESDQGTYRKNGAIRERARELGGRLGKSPTQIAVAWLLNQPLSVYPIVGTTRIDHLQDSIGSIGIELSKDEMKWLRHPANI